jgi:hypothetical protein
MLRLILAGLIGVTVLVAGLFAAAVVVLTGLAAYVLQLFRGKAGPVRPGRTPAPNRQPNLRTDDVIDV